MSYPIEILPNHSYKKIECKLADHHLIRHTKTSDIDELWNMEFDCLKVDCIAMQSSHAMDLSTSLLGIFTGLHTQIELTATGRSKFDMDCAPNESIDPCPCADDFVLNVERCYWLIQIDLLTNKSMAYHIDNEKFTATCHVIHSPMKWNYWHFSVRWMTHEGFLHENPGALKKKWVRRLGHDVIRFISQNAVLLQPIISTIPEDCYVASK